jgi:hypothetical protein
VLHDPSYHPARLDCASELVLSGDPTGGPIGTRTRVSTRRGATPRLAAEPFTVAATSAATMISS